MTVLDTSVVIERIKTNEDIHENITMVTIVEYPKIVYYKRFYGNILLPTFLDYITAHKIQNLLIKNGKAKNFADLLIASICINRNEKLITKDKDFLDITEISKLNVNMM